MLNRPSTSSIFIIIAVLVVIVAPFIIFFWPLFQLITFRFDAENLLMTVPMKNFYLLIAAFAIFIIVLVILAFKRTKLIFLLMSLPIIASIVFIYFSSLSYIQIHPEFVRIKDFHIEKTYPMDEMATIIYEYDKVENGRYLFYTKDDELITIADTPLLDAEKHGKLRSIAKGKGVEFIERPIDEE